MPLILRCDCGKKLQVREALAGLKVRCPGCRKILLAPVPAEEEPLDLLEAIEEESAPAAPKTPMATAVKASAPFARPSSKKKLPPAHIDEEDEDEDTTGDENKPTPYWHFSTMTNTEVMAVGSTGIWFAKLKGDALERAEERLDRGMDPGNAFAGMAWCIPWDAVKSIYCNKKRAGFSIKYIAGRKNVAKHLKPDNGTRAEIFKTIEKLLRPDWQRQTTHHTPVTATGRPLAWLLLDIFLTGLFAFLAQSIRNDPQFGSGGKMELVVAISLRDLGPIWTSVIGILIAFGLILWLFMRVLDPPVDVNIVRSPVSPG